MVEQPGAPFQGIPTVVRSLGSVQLPDVPLVDPGDGGEPFPPWLLVSSLVLEAAQVQRHPLLSCLLAPDAGPTAIRKGGQVIAVTRLVWG